MLGRHLVLTPFPPSLPEPGVPLPAHAIPFRAIEPERPDGDAPGPIARPDAPSVYVTLGTEFNVESGDLFARVRKLGLALTLDPVSATPEDVRVAVRAVLDDPSYRRAAERMRHEIESLPEPAHAVTAIEKLAARFRG